MSPKSTPQSSLPPLLALPPLFTPSDLLTLLPLPLSTPPWRTCLLLPVPLWQPSRKQTKRQLTQAEKASRAAAAEVARNHQMEVADAVKAFHPREEAEIKAEAARLSLKTDYFRRLVRGKINVKPPREPSLREALTSAKAADINKDREVKLRLRKIVDELDKDDDMSTSNLTQEEKDALIARLKEKKATKGTAMRASNTGAAKDHTASTKRMRHELDTGGLRNGTLGFFFVTRAHINDTLATDFYGNAHALQIFKDILGKDPAEVARLFDMWSCTNSKNIQERNNYSVIKSQCSHLVTFKLQQATRSKPKMNYVNIHKFAATHKIKIKGWPPSIEIGNPSDVLHNIDEAILLRDALVSGACHWAQMTDAEVAAHHAEMARLEAEGKPVGKRRKARSDKGKTHKKRKQDEDAKGCVSRRQKKVKSVAIIESEDEDDDEDYQSDE
ncbi:hypothetical protein CONPUDRAFT_77576 [Coniophora puteana RWD-64-598 SS2]|uniref:Uncharacterized protein n=1 Tax=Coniophora puteana (strain RWD-64-598) TaxID=741705 RepID=A0A5M3M8L3_CONPW|nr:uncharacterized protein CONPUDRAFT_77576 [Coniophora puteana RWD-64-598 SS2]EIW75387.1 hypothetical protein CONPUDRAFT_77576 [Coniophora puteana RWD-64-598 SS2]